MIVRLTQRKLNSPRTGLFGFIERYYLVLLGLIFAFPIVLRYLRDAQTKQTTNDIQEDIKENHVVNLNPTTQALALSQVTVNPFYHNLAKNLAHHLGTIYSSKGNWYDFLDPRGWTENDTATYKELKQITNTGQRTTVVKLYFILTSRDLIYDVKSYLDSELLAKLPLFK